MKKKTSLCFWIKRNEYCCATLTAILFSFFPLFFFVYLALLCVHPLLLVGSSPLASLLLTFSLTFFSPAETCARAFSFSYFHRDSFFARLPLLSRTLPDAFSPLKNFSFRLLSPSSFSPLRFLLFHQFVLSSFCLAFFPHAISFFLYFLSRARCCREKCFCCYLIMSKNFAQAKVWLGNFCF